jgi:hypothetical protein
LAKIRKPISRTESHPVVHYTSQTNMNSYESFSVAQQPTLGLGRLIVEVSKAQTNKRARDQLVKEAATYATNTRANTHTLSGISNLRSQQ